MRFSALVVVAALSFQEEKLDAVTRVIGLLKKMEEQLEKEKEDDANLYEELKCWCKTNDEEKRAALKANNAHADELLAEIQERAARDGELKTQISQLKKDIAKHTESLQVATSLREKEHDSFNKDEKEMLAAVTNLKNAILVLSKHHQGLIQMTPELQESVASVLKDAADRHAIRDAMTKNLKHPAFLSVAEGVEKQHRYFLSALQGRVNVQMPANFASRIVASFAQQPAGFKSYNSRSGQIFGILQTMQDEFEANMSDAQKAELQAQEEFDQLSASKKSQIAAGTEQLNTKKQQQAENEKALADAKDDLVGTRGDLRADTDFLVNLTLQCKDIDHQNAQRTKTRQEEIAAVSEAIGILSDDDARDLTRRTVSFLQNGNRRARAAAVLIKALPVDDLEGMWSSRSKPSLATLATTVKLQDFTRVFQAMDEMTVELKNQQADEVKHRDYCNDEFRNNERQNTKNTHLNQDQTDTIDELANKINNLKELVKQSTDEINSLRTEIKRSGENREHENEVFQETINDQRATQAVLAKALNRLKEFYSKKAFVQVQQHQEPPKKFAAYKNNSGASPVLSMIEKIVEESKAVEKEAIDDEQQAQTDYQTFVKDSNNSITNLQISITNKNRVIADSKEDRQGFLQDRAATRAELENLVAYKQDLHQSCDFVIKNFDVRQQARLEEIEAIGAAKAILSGAQV
eukprot:GEMP01022507.1.p1 GENE.GEMP01022507.1~~GEMP01022507.1.p1  ORF type:complete len:693 (+),score=231.64 GEMP01022507.1:111-2189(+)